MKNPSFIFLLFKVKRNCICCCGKAHFRQEYSTLDLCELGSTEVLLFRD
jgi:hypothetical protein